jgi:hypothetical protein
MDIEIFSNAGWLNVDQNNGFGPALNGVKQQLESSRIRDSRYWRLPSGWRRLQFGKETQIEFILAFWHLGLMAGKRIGATMLQFFVFIMMRQVGLLPIPVIFSA